MLDLIAKVLGSAGIEDMIQKYGMRKVGAFILESHDNN